MKFRVMEGRRAFPYNDGEGPKTALPGMVLPGDYPESFRQEFSGWLEPVDAEGKPLPQAEIPQGDEMAILAARPHERVTLLEQHRDRLREALDAIEKRIESERTKSEKLAEQRQPKARTGAGTTDPRVGSAGQAEPQPRVTAHTGTAQVHEAKE